MTGKKEYTGFLATYEDGRDLRRYIPIMAQEHWSLKVCNHPWASDMAHQRWYLEPGWYKVTIEPWYPPGLEPFEEEVQ